MTDDLVLEARHFVPAGASPAPAASPVDPAAAPAAARAAAPAPAPPVAVPPAAAVMRPLSQQVAEVERAAIAAALRACAGNRVRAAEQLGMSRAALYDRLARWPELAALPAADLSEGQTDEVSEY
jgi:DNA-binding NtrC family response regulator